MAVIMNNLARHVLDTNHAKLTTTATTAATTTTTAPAATTTPMTIANTRVLVRFARWSRSPTLH
eukprot:6648805-Alexandrium_andersonii.AAC.1